MNIWILAAALIAADPPVVPVAFVLEVKGTVTREHESEKAQPLLRQDFLRPGDRLVTLDGGSALLLLATDGHLERLGPNARFTLTEKGCEPPDAVRRQDAKVGGSNLSGLRNMVRSGRPGGSIFRDPEEGPAPRISPIDGTNLLYDRPTFAWPAAAKAVSYRVELLRLADSKVEHVLWREPAVETHLKYPAKKPPLEPGLPYRWRVYAIHGAGREEAVARGSFIVAMAKSREQLAGLKKLADSADDADRLTAALTYEAFGVFEEALALFEKLADCSPAEPSFQVALANYYALAGLHDRSRAAQAKAEKLGAVSDTKRGRAATTVPKP
jgi:hypothetical protein